MIKDIIVECDPVPTIKAFEAVKALYNTGVFPSKEEVETCLKEHLSEHDFHLDWFDGDKKAASIYVKNHSEREYRVLTITIQSATFQELNGTLGNADTYPTDGKH